VTTGPLTTGPVVVVTGATSGIGRATALAYARQGSRLVLAARSRRTLADTERECRAAGAADVLVVPTDVTRSRQCDALAAAAVDRFDVVDVCVHAAAVVAYGTFLDVPVEVFDRAVTTNLLGTANVARSVLPVMRDQRRGTLVVVGSVLGQVTVPYLSAYVTGKWGVRALTRTLGQEMRDVPGVRVRSVSPGSVNTPVYTQAGSYSGRGHRPPPPVDPPEKVAAAVLRAAGRRRREVSVGWANPVMVAGHTLLPAVYDALVGPLMRVAGVTGQRRPPSPGNVLEPHEPGEAVHGPWSGWGHLGRRNAPRDDDR
jgi:NAD(P)-dependent dehydrogenase (short-subunit alcohol dehydrogenase family)